MYLNYNQLRLKRYCITQMAVDICWFGVDIIFMYLRWAFSLMSYFSGFKCEIFLMSKERCCLSKSLGVSEIVGLSSSFPAIMLFAVVLLLEAMF